MAALKPTRSVQKVMEGEFTFTIGDTMVNTSGAADAFATVASHVFDIINLPPGATVLSGEVVTDTAFAGSTAYNVSIGDSASATRYLGVTDKTTAARTALVPTGYIGLGENLRMTWPRPCYGQPERSPSGWSTQCSVEPTKSSQPKRPDERGFGPVLISTPGEHP